MNATTNDARIMTVAAYADAKTMTEGARLAQNVLLSEMPGAVLAIVTLFYTVSSLVALI